MHEAVQARVGLDDLESGPQIQVKGVAENDFGARLHELLGRHRLHRAVSADRHERRRLDAAAREVEPAPARVAIGREHLETHARRCAHGAARAPAAGLRNIASP